MLWGFLSGDAKVGKDGGRRGICVYPNMLQQVELSRACTPGASGFTAGSWQVLVKTAFLTGLHPDRRQRWAVQIQKHRTGTRQAADSRDKGARFFHPIPQGIAIQPAQAREQPQGAPKTIVRQLRNSNRKQKSV